jgi:hypothetical protein
MPTTPLLGITQVSTSQNSKEVTINDAITALEDATNRGILLTAFASGTTSYTLTTTEATRNFIYRAKGTPTAAITLNFPVTVNGANYNRIFAVRNESGQQLTVKFASGAGTTVVIPNNQTRLIAALDGLNMIVAAEPQSAVNFLSLSDTPGTFAGVQGKFLGVNVAEDALVFLDAATFPDYVANAGKVLTVKETEDGVEWADASLVATFLDLTDVPSSYTGQGGKLAAVKNDESGIEFVDTPPVEAVEFVSAQRWRLRVITPGSETQVGFGEIEFQNNNGFDQTGTGTATASNFESGKEPAQAFDDDSTTIGSGWLTEETFVGEAWIEYDFGEAKTIRSVKAWATPGFPSFAPTRFAIEYYNGSDWIEVGDRATAAWVDGEPQTFTVNGVPLSSVSDAPANGTKHVRVNNAWDPLPVDEAPVDSKQYARKDGDWNEIVVPDALPDYTNNAGKHLAVKSDESGAEWVEAATGGGAARDVTVAIVNPGFEDGSTGWTLTSMSVTGANPGGHSITPRTGGGIAVADAVANAYASQIVAIDSGDYTAIDAGDVEGTFEAYASQTFNIPERAHYTISFLDAADADLGGALTTTYEGSAQNSWSQMLLQGVFPVGTRKLKFELRAQRLDGTNNNMAFDDIAATYTVPAAFVAEAPKDGKQYARMDGDWAEVVASGGGGGGGSPLTEASFSVSGGSTTNGITGPISYAVADDPEGWLIEGNKFKPNVAGFYYVHSVLTANNIRGSFVYKNGASYDGYTGGILAATYSTFSTSMVYCDGVNDYFDIRAHSNSTSSFSGGESQLRIVGPFQSSGGGGGEPVDVELTREYTVKNAGDAFIDLPLDAFNATEFDLVVHGTTSVDAAVYARLSNDNCATQLSGAADYKNRASNSDSKINLISQTIGSGRPYIAEFRLAGMNGGATPKNFMLSGTGYDVNNSGGGTAFVLGGYPNALGPDDYNGIRIYVSAGNMDGLKVVLTPRVKTISASIPAGTTAVEASNTEVWTGTAGDRFISPARMVAAAVPVVLTDGATITPDLTAGMNFSVTLAGNRTLENPTNAQPGDSGIIIVTQDATGSRTLAYGTNWKFPGGAPTLTTAANAVDLITYFVRSNGTIIATLSKDFK